MKAASNTSTLINFYRTNYYPLLKSLFDQILVPSLCWEELISGDAKIDKQYADRVRLLEDKEDFLSVVDVDVQDELVKKPIKVAEEVFAKRTLDEPEALTIALSLKGNSDYLLTDDVVAIRVLEILRKDQPEQRFPKVLNTAGILGKAVKNMILFYARKENLNKFLDNFEQEAGIKFSEGSRANLIETWRTSQARKKKE